MYQKSWSYAILFLRYGTWWMELLFLILDYFLHFYLPNNPKNENFKKIKKTPGDVIILHKFTKNHDHMVYWSWDMPCCVTDVIIFHFGLFFALSPPKNETCPNLHKNENEKKWKKKEKKTPGDIIILHKCNRTHDHMLYCSWDMAHDGCNCYFSFWAIFALLPP